MPHPGPDFPPDTSSELPLLDLSPIAEAMLALVLIDHALRHRGQNADVVCATPRVPASVAKDQVSAIQTTYPVENPEPDEA